MVVVCSCLFHRAAKSSIFEMCRLPDCLQESTGCHGQSMWRHAGQNCRYGRERERGASGPSSHYISRRYDHVINMYNINIYTKI